MSVLTVRDLPPIDPWWDLYMPAMFGEVDAVLDALEAGEAGVPLARRGDLYAVAARALAMLGRLTESQRLTEQALSLGGREAEALATFVRPEGVAIAQERMQSSRAGVAADAACDLAALRLLAGDLHGAHDAVEDAEARCPGHGEAGRWARFFAGTEDPAKAVRGAKDPRRARRALTGPVMEAVDLLPTRRTGWLSTERYHRRILGTPPASGWAPAATGLGRLHDAGVSLCFFALDVEYARVPADHPLVALEVEADAVRASVEEGWDAAGRAAALWARVGCLDAEARSDAAQLLAGLGTADARLAPVALDAVAWLAQHRPARAQLWEGYAAWLEHLAGVGGGARARALAAARPADALAWRMAVETLRGEGATAEADRIVRAARSEPALSAVACEVLETAGGTPFRMVVSGRIVPRWARTPGARW